MSGLTVQKLPFPVDLSMGALVGSLGSLALKASIPGGALFGLVYKVSKYIGTVILKQINVQDGLSLIGGMYAIKILCAGAAAYAFLPLSSIAMLTAGFLAVDAVAVLIFCDLWLL